MTDSSIPLLWLLISFPVLLLLQRWIHTHLHGISLLLTGKAERAVIVYALVLLPGVFLHELSHWVTANLLGVRTGRFSLIPRRMKDGSLQLGYVEYYRDKSLGPIRESLIGGAPLIVGTAVIWLIANRVFNVELLGMALQSGDVTNLTFALSDFFQTDDVFLWLYLIFAVSNAMMPSRSDQRAWPAFLLLMGVTIVVVYALGWQTAVFNSLRNPIITTFGYLGIAFTMAIGVDLFFMLILGGFEYLLGRLRGVNVVYGRS